MRSPASLTRARQAVIRGPFGLFSAVAEDRSSAVQSLVALALNSATSLVAGAVLGSITGTLERLPGLLVLVPAAIGLRGNVFSALGSRLSTSIHTGSYRPSLRRHGVLYDNVVASLLLTSGLALALAVVAKGAATAFGLEHTISVVDLAIISIAGGLLASVLVLIATVALANGAIRFGWDLDNLVAPVVSTLGDVLTLPALWLATFLIGRGTTSTLIAWVLIGPTVVGVVYGLTTRQSGLRSIIRQSWPVLLAAVALSTLAGLVIEGQLATLTAEPALLILVPAFVSSAGALGGILSSRYASGLHLGTLQGTGWPQRVARREALVIAGLAVPIYLFNAVGAYIVADLLGNGSPGLPGVLAACLLGAVGAVAFVVAVAYYGAVASVRLRVDPDTYGIPLVTSSVDFVGSIALILAIAAVGIP